MEATHPAPEPRAFSLGHISPKVIYPVIAGLIAFVVTGITSGFWDTANLTVLLSTGVAALLGVGAPPASGVSQAEVLSLAAAKKAAPKEPVLDDTIGKQFDPEAKP